MKTFLPKDITCPEQAEAFIASLVANDEIFHLEDDPAECTTNSGKDMFTSEEARQINKLLGQIFELLPDPCATALYYLDKNQA